MTNNDFIWDVITYTFQEEELIPLGKSKEGENLYGDLDLLTILINSGGHGDLIAVSETQQGLSIYIRNTIGLNDNISILDTKEWQRDDPAGQYSQFKTLFVNVLMSDV
jgi:hypothetical protein